MVRLRSTLLAASLLALAGPAWANNPPPDPLDAERRGGNAIDNAAGKTAQPARPPGYYEVMGDFWAQFLGQGADAAVGSMLWMTSPEELPPTSSADLYIKPIDGPAESVLDQIDESQAGLVLVGTPGSAQESGAPQERNPRLRRDRRRRRAFSTISTPRPRRRARLLTLIPPSKRSTRRRRRRLSKQRASSRRRGLTVSPAAPHTSLGTQDMRVTWPKTWHLAQSSNASMKPRWSQACGPT